MSLFIGKSQPGTVFQLLGLDENSATFALGWTMERSPHLAGLFLGDVLRGPSEPCSIHIELQRHGRDGGFTDMELRRASDVHVIVEAKRGMVLPTIDQLVRYRPRFDQVATGSNALVSLSALGRDIAERRLPKDVDGVPLVHIAWRDVVALAKVALRARGGYEERVWLRQLIQHLEAFAAMDMTRDNMVYVVSLGSGSIRSESPYTWVDVVKGGRYFHPIGQRWPTQPPNYIGFRYAGELRSVHRIVRHDVVRDVSSVNPLWPTTAADHFVYELGPAMRPPSTMRAGVPGDAVQRSARVYAAIDTLLTGEFSLLGKAVDATKRRLAAAGLIASLDGTQGADSGNELDIEG